MKFLKRSPSAVILGLLLPLGMAPLWAASLGEVQVGSSLGERFEASIPVKHLAEAAVGVECFRIGPAHDEGAQGLGRARLAYHPSASGGRLLIRGLDLINEPILSFQIIMRCEGEGEVRRQYTVFIDPKKIVADPVPVTVSQQGLQAAALPEAKAGNAARRLGGVWVTRPGDSIEGIGLYFYPTQRTKRSLFQQLLRERNSGLPEGDRALLAEGRELQLPSSREVRQALPQLATTQQTVAPAPAPTRKQVAAPLDPVVQAAPASEQFSLRLSGIELDVASRPQLSEAERLKLKERLLLLDADDQTAKLLQLQNQIHQMEQHLAGLQNNLATPTPPMVAKPVTPKTTQPKPKPYSWMDEARWVLWGLGIIGGVVALAAGAYLVRRRDTGADDASLPDYYVNGQDGRGLFVIDTIAGEPPVAEVTPKAEKPVAAPVVQPVDEWAHNEMDVFQPSSIAEEAALLAEHGLFEQACALLRPEIDSHPKQLALWMQLFQIYRKGNMKAEYAEMAAAFRKHFASPALWTQVRMMGLEIDPGFELYQSDLTLVNQRVLEVEPLESAPDSAKPSDVVAANAKGAPEAKSGGHTPFWPAATEEDVEDHGPDTVALNAPLEFSLPDALEKPQTAFERQQVLSELASVSERLRDVQALFEAGMREESIIRLEQILLVGSLDEKIAASKMLEAINQWKQ